MHSRESLRRDAGAPSELQEIDRWSPALLCEQLAHRVFRQMVCVEVLGRQAVCVNWRGYRFARVPALRVSSGRTPGGGPS
jgi:hypothetical protein